MSRKYNRKARQESAVARNASRPPETLKSLSDRLARLPISGNSTSEIAKLQHKIGILEQYYLNAGAA